MVGLVDIAPVTATVVVRGNTLTVVGVSATGFSMAWATPDTIATVIGLITPVLVWAIPNKKVA